MGDRAALEAELEYVKDVPGFERTNPQFMSDPMIDKLVDVVLLLAGEVWTNRDRLMIIEHLLASKGRVTPGMIETFKPDADFAKEAELRRMQLIRNVFSRMYNSPEPHSERDFFKAWTEEKDDSV